MYLWTILSFGKFLKSFKFWRIGPYEVSFLKDVRLMPHKECKKSVLWLLPIGLFAAQNGALERTIFLGLPHVFMFSTICLLLSHTRSFRLLAFRFSLLRHSIEYVHTVSSFFSFIILLSTAQVLRICVRVYLLFCLCFYRPKWTCVFFFEFNPSFSSDTAFELGFGIFSFLDPVNVCNFNFIHEPTMSKLFLDLRLF